MANRSATRLKNVERYRESERINQKRRRERTRVYLAALKQLTGCTDCGNIHPAVLQFHHLDPTKKDGTVREMIAEGKSERRVLAEIGKCIVLCANCHAIRHWEERQ